MIFALDKRLLFGQCVSWHNILQDQSCISHFWKFELQYNETASIFLVLASGQWAYQNRECLTTIRYFSVTKQLQSTTTKCAASDLLLRQSILRWPESVVGHNRSVGMRAVGIHQSHYPFHQPIGCSYNISSYS